MNEAVETVLAGDGLPGALWVVIWIVVILLVVALVLGLIRRL